MATSQSYNVSAAPKQDKDATVEGIKVRSEAQKYVLNYCKAILEKSKQWAEFKNKLDAIDIAYARYKENLSKVDTTDGQDIADTANMCCDVFADDDVTPPIVVSQVDSYVAYLAEVFLSGSPIFPVVSPPGKRKRAEELEALIDDHANLGAYPRHLLMFLRDCAKYNFGACEANWDSMEQYTVLQDIASNSGQKMGKKPKKFTKLKRLNPRNVIWDWNVSLGEVSEHGDYAGYVEKYSRTRLKRLLTKFGIEGKGYNIDKALASSCTVNGYTPNYTENPVISNYLTSTPQHRTGVDWDSWWDPKAGGTRRNPSSGQMYEVFTLYARIMPADFGIAAPSRNTPQIWKFIIVNNEYMVFADRIISAYDYLPILFGSPLEDGMDYQTQSVAEGEIPFQEAANTLFNIRFAAARRSVSDRALYLPDMIKPSDINAATPAPKIPVSISQLSQKKLSDAYHQIPFDMRGTESAIQDAALIVSFSKELHGVNNPRAGNFQKGNKSVQEWNDTMGGSDGRLRLPALTLEHQFFSPLKSIIALNLFQYGENAVVVSQVTGNSLDIKIDELRAEVLSFKIADGLTPKSKLASTEVLLAGMNMISQSVPLQQAYGGHLPGMFAHFMSLAGVKGFDQYDPANNPTQTGGLGLPGNVLQAPATPAVQPAASVQPTV